MSRLLLAITILLNLSTAPIQSHITKTLLLTAGSAATVVASNPPTNTMHRSGLRVGLIWTITGSSWLIQELMKEDSQATTLEKIFAQILLTTIALGTVLYLKKQFDYLKHNGAKKPRSANHPSHKKNISIFQDRWLCPLVIITLLSEALSLYTASWETQLQKGSESFLKLPLAEKEKVWPDRYHSYKNLSIAQDALRAWQCMAAAVLLITLYEEFDATENNA